MQTLTVERLESTVIPETLKTWWQNLASTPLQSPEWLMTWWEEFKSPTAQLCLLVVRRDGFPIGLAPWMTRDTWTFGRKVQFLGSGKACTDFQSLLIAPGEESAVIDAVGAWLTQGDGHRIWDVIELEGIAGDSSELRRLLTLLKKYRATVQTTPLEDTWRLELTGGWEGFLGRLSKSQRGQARNLTNRFDKNEDLSFRVIHSVEQLPESFDACVRLHQARWQAVGEPGCFADQRFTNFLRSAFLQLTALGKAEISLLELNGRPVAAQLVLKDANGNRFVYQTGRDPTLESARIGQILTLLSIRHACRMGVEFIDFLRGNECYKSRLRAAPADCWRVRVYAPKVLPKLRYEAWRVSRGLRCGASSIAGLLGHNSGSAQSLNAD